MPISFRYAARTDVGLGRKTRNEDSAYAGPELLVLADGMGGHVGGDVASSIVVGHLVPLDGDAHGGDDMLTRLADAIAEANERLASAAEDHPELEGMGTTCIAMLRSGSKVAMATIGDSRAYLVRDGRLSQISKDHSFVQQLLDEGRITEDEALHHPQRPLVTRVLTGKPDDVPDLSLRELRKGDRYILCSDGLTDYVAPDTVKEVATMPGTPAEVAEALIALALRASTRDNVTVVVAEAISATDSYSNAPVVVGAAAERDRSGRGANVKTPITPAEKAAALARTVSPSEPDPDEDYFSASPLLDEEHEPTRVGRWAKRLAAVLVVLLALAGVGWLSWSWTQTQYYIAAKDGKVAVYRGVPGSLGPWDFSRVEQQTDVGVDTLPQYYQERVDSTMTFGSREEADAALAELQGLSTPAPDPNAPTFTPTTLPPLPTTPSLTPPVITPAVPTTSLPPISPSVTPMPKPTAKPTVSPKPTAQPTAKRTAKATTTPATKTRATQ